MSKGINSTQWNQLRKQLSGELKLDELTKIVYATDASVYRKIPLGVVFPKNTQDLQTIVMFATTHHINLIPRTAGTSLAGQCVGEGLIVDISKHFTQILKIDPKAKTVTVQPGVIRDDLNRYLEAYGLFFGPNTSTSNRCMIGGMVGNNSSGTTSIRYGVTRDKVLELKKILCNGEEVVFNSLSEDAFLQKTKQQDVEGQVYQKINQILKEENNKNEIITNYPKPEIHRRNTGYALDVLLRNSFFSKKKNNINLCNILTGSEGTLGITTEITLQLDNLPPVKAAMIAAHFSSIEQCMQAVVPVMKHKLYTCEMMDKTILDCTKNNKTQLENRFFIEKDPKAILMLELRSDTTNDLQKQIKELLITIEKSGLSYAFPVLYNQDIDKAIELRKAGLGLLGNIIGDKKAVACIEDTAVAIEDLAEYITEFTDLMKQYNQEAVYYAHAGAGEIHLRPILNLKVSTDVLLFTQITDAVATLVKKYNGVMSGEHGDGIVRSKYIEQMLGTKNYSFLQEIKTTFDPQYIFNRGKIIDPLPMDQNLRYIPNAIITPIETLLDFSDSQGILRASEKCNGSGDCRKSMESGGTMCPSYRVTKNEKDTTRARANVLREVLTNITTTNPFNREELKEVLDLCVSCKACASECPSSVDMASLKAEVQYQYHKTNKRSLRDLVFVYNNTLNRWSSQFSGLSNWIFKNKITSSIIKKSLHIAPKRSLPQVSSTSFQKWLITYLKKNPLTSPIKEVYLFVDEFTNYLDTKIGQDTVILLTKLNYKINFIPHFESGRALLSKGFLKQAEQIANKNITIFKTVITNETPLVGIEPSAILTFRDEYKRLAIDKKSANSLAKKTFLIDEFIANEIKKGSIPYNLFTDEKKEIKLHAHCHQKALSNSEVSFTLLNFPINYKVNILNAGCCGMAGSFGYEKEHYDVSMKMGELSLFPKIRKANSQTIIAATGTSCRHQIEEGTKRIALHPISILKNALL